MAKPAPKRPNITEAKRPDFRVPSRISPEGPPLVAKYNHGKGNPSFYDPHYDHIVYKLRLLGKTTSEIAYIVGVSDDAIKKWVSVEPTFRAAWQAGGDLADGDVAVSLFQRAVGYEHQDCKIFNTEKGLVYAPFTKRYPPDSSAAMYWLNNRNRWRWRNTQTTEITGPEGAPLSAPTLTINFIEGPGEKPSDTSIIDGESYATE